MKPVKGKKDISEAIWWFADQLTETNFQLGEIAAELEKLNGSEIKR
jgi:hypothetical protein